MSARKKYIARIITRTAPEKKRMPDDHPGVCAGSWPNWLITCCGNGMRGLLITKLFQSEPNSYGHHGIKLRNEWLDLRWLLKLHKGRCFHNRCSKLSFKIFFDAEKVGASAREHNTLRFSCHGELLLV